MLTYFYYVFTDIGIRQKIYLLLDRDIYTANYTHRKRILLSQQNILLCVLHVKREKTLLLFDITVKLVL